MIKIFIASDHAGIELKKELCESPDLLRSEEHSIQFIDCGPHHTQSVDYPDFAKKACDLFLEEEKKLKLFPEAFASYPEGILNFGVLICGSGIGMSIAANKITGIRALLSASSPNALEYAKLSREHNHTNFICFGARFMKSEEVISTLKTFLKTNPSLEERHLHRVKKLECSITED